MALPNFSGLTIKNPGMNTVLSSVAQLQYSSNTWVSLAREQYEILKWNVQEYRYQYYIKKYFKLKNRQK